jgi:formate dehydrogenase
VQVADAEVLGEIDRLEQSNGATGDYPLSMIGLRELRSHNSWMHNSPLLMRGGRTHSLRIHPDDAAAAGLADGATARITSASGAVEVPVTLTDEMTPGTVALPHGWGHRGGWKLAAGAGGANVNQLAPSAPESLERLAGMAHLNGIPVRVEAVARTEASQPAATAEPAVPAQV